MAQQTLSDIEYSNRRRRTKRELFLLRMDGLLPWKKWVKRIRPFYPAGIKGRRPREIETMLRMYCLRLWYGLSDQGVEDAVFDSYAMRSFMGIDFFAEQVPGASTLGKFRRLLEKEGIAEELVKETEEILRAAGYTLHKGSITDASGVRLPGKGKDEIRQQ